MPDTYPILKVAAVQASPVYMNRDATIDKACSLIKEAADHGARIVAFPESYVSGYPYFYSTLLSNPFLEEKRRFVEFFKSAIEISSPSTETLCQAARGSNIYVVMGINERDPISMGTVYNSQLFIDRRGKIMGVHRKLVPTSYEKLCYARGDGGHLSVFDTDFGEMSGLICGEHANSLAKFSLIARGEKIHVASWAAFPENIFSSRQNETVLFRVRQHAHEGKLFVISSSGHFSQDMIDQLCNTEEERSRIQLGGGCSAIIGVNGEFLGGPLYGQEGIVYAEINFQDIIEAKLKHDLLGHYSRFDVLSLNFNDEKLIPIHYVHRRWSESDDSDGIIGTIKTKLDTIEQKLGSLLEEEKKGETT
jgi:nitrilase